MAAPSPVPQNLDLIYYQGQWFVRAAPQQTAPEGTGSKVARGVGVIMLSILLAGSVIAIIAGVAIFEDYKPTYESAQAQVDELNGHIYSPLLQPQIDDAQAQADEAMTNMTDGMVMAFVGLIVLVISAIGIWVLARRQ